MNVARRALIASVSSSSKRLPALTRSALLCRVPLRQALSVSLLSCLIFAGPPIFTPTPPPALLSQAPPYPFAPCGQTSWVHRPSAGTPCQKRGRNVYSCVSSPLWLSFSPSAPLSSHITQSSRPEVRLRKESDNPSQWTVKKSPPGSSSSRLSGCAASGSLSRLHDTLHHISFAYYQTSDHLAKFEEFTSHFSSAFFNTRLYS